MNTFDQDELLADIARSLRELAMSNREIADGIAIMRKRAEMHPGARPIRYFSGRWPVRDGNTYGIVQAQPPIQEPSPEPEVIPEDKTGRL